MINCFPRIYDDELLYSVMSRYRRMCGLINKRTIGNDFYNRKVKTFQFLFPLHLNAMSNILPASSKITGEQLLSQNTMYPYYTKFLSKKITDDIKDSMLNRDNVCIIIQIGLNNANRENNKFLKYCPMCLQEDIENFGESYWRREHQFIGVFFCSKHEIQLQNSEVNMSNINNEYVCADDIKVTYIDSIDGTCKKYNLEYIKLVKELMKIDVDGIKLSKIKNFYRYKLYNMGLATEKGRIDKDNLCNKFKEFYSDNYLKLMGCDFQADESNWLRVFFNKYNKSVLKHLLLLQFLNSSLEELFHFNESIQYERIGNNKHIAKLDLEKRKDKWLEIIKNNPNKSRMELKEIGGTALSKYVCYYDKEWYNQVTPKNNIRKKRISSIDWNKKDEELLEKVKVAIYNILNVKGKPIRVCNTSIRRELRMTLGNFNIKLVKTRELIKLATESNEQYWKRKIKWAIEELIKNGEIITRYNIQGKCGFSGMCGEEVKKLIDRISDEI